MSEWRVSIGFVQFHYIDENGAAEWVGAIDNLNILLT
jgi:hypothetical protein